MRETREDECRRRAACSDAAAYAQKGDSMVGREAMRGREVKSVRVRGGRERREMRQASKVLLRGSEGQ